MKSGVRYVVLLVAGFVAALGACKQPRRMDVVLQHQTPLKGPAREAVEPNFGMKMSQVSAAAHLNCGVDEKGAGIAWGVGDFVEVPHYPLKRIVCADAGNGVVAVEGFTAYGHSERFTSLVGSHHLTASVDIALTTSPNGFALNWSLEPNGRLLSTVGSTMFLPGTFARIAGGDWGVCGLRTNGTMFCEQAQSQPGVFTELAVGGLHQCAIDKQGSIHCFGSNSHGQSTAPAGAYAQVSAGRHHTCAITKTGELACWGAGKTSRGCWPPAWECGQALAPPIKWKSVQAGGYHTCAIAADDRVACWGLNDRGQAKAPVRHSRAESSLRCGFRPTKAHEAPLLCWDELEKSGKHREAFTPKVAKLAGSQSMLCALLEDGRVACMRAPVGMAKHYIPAFRVPDVRFATLEVDDKQACGTTLSGEPLCFTVANWSQAPIAKGAKAAFPAPLATLSIMADGHIEARGHDWAKEKVPQGRFKKLCGGGHWYTSEAADPNDRRRVHACALSDEGRVSCWGDAPKGLAGTFDDILCGQTFVCGRKAGRSIACSDREGKSISSYENEEFLTFSTNGNRVMGALKDLDEVGYGVGMIFMVDEVREDRPKGLFDGYWLGAGVECGRRPGKAVTCWGDGVEALRVTADVRTTLTPPASSRR